MSLRQNVVLSLSILFLTVGCIFDGVHAGVIPALEKVKIDGDLTEWKDRALKIELNRADQTVWKWRGPADLSAWIYLGADKKYFYLGAEITDDIFSAEDRAASMWMGDGIQFSFDTLANNREAGYDDDDYEYGLGLIRGRSLCYAWHVAGGKRTGLIRNVKLAIIRKGNSTVYECRLLWKELRPFLPVKDARFRFNVLVNDSDGTGRKSWLELTPGIGLSKDPSQYKSFTLGESFAGEGSGMASVLLKDKICEDKMDLLVKVTSVSELTEAPFHISISDTAGKLIKSFKESIDLQPGSNEKEISLEIMDLPDGNYQVAISFPHHPEIAVWREGEFYKYRKATLLAEVEKVKEKSKALSELISEGREEGLDLSYQRSLLQLVTDFSRYALDDWNNGRGRRALEVVSYIKDACQRAIDQTRGILSDPAQDRVNPRYHTGNWQMEEGAFFQDGKPVFFLGVGHFGQVRKDVPKFPEYGFNIIQIEFGPNSVVNPDGTYSDGAINAFLEVAENAVESNIAINLLLSSHYFPSWATTYPDVASCSYGFFKYCVNNPYARKVLRRSLEYVIPRIKDCPALHSYCLSNEPIFKGDCPYCRQLFVNWLWEKHGNLAEMNRCWGTSFQSLDEIWKSGMEQIPGLWYDWCIWNQEEFANFHAWMKGIIRQFDQKTPVHAKIMNTVWSRGNVNNGVDPIKFCRISDINGNDCAAMPGGAYYFDWQGQAMFYDLKRSYRPDQPVFNSEDHIIRDDDPQYYTSKGINAALWHQFLHGQGAGTIWVWERGQHGDLAHNILTRPNCVEAATKTTLDVMRLREEILSFQRQLKEVALFYSMASIINQEGYLGVLTDVYEALYFCDLPVRFLSAEGIQENNVQGIKLLIMPNAQYVRPVVIDFLKDFVSKGGKVLFVGESILKDVYGRLYEVVFEGDNVKYIKKRSTAREYQRDLESALSWAEIERLVRWRGRGNWGIALRALPFHGKLLVSIINFNYEDKKVSLQSDLSLGRIKDLLSGEVVKSSLVAKPAVPLLLEIEVRGKVPELRKQPFPQVTKQVTVPELKEVYTIKGVLTWLREERSFNPVEDYRAVQSAIEQLKVIAGRDPTQAQKALFLAGFLAFYHGFDIEQAQRLWVKVSASEGEFVDDAQFWLLGLEEYRRAFAPLSVREGLRTDIAEKYGEFVKRYPDSMWADLAKSKISKVTR